MFIVVMAGFALGYSRRADMLRRERVLSELGALAAAFRANAQYEHDSALVCLEKFAASERAAALSFLPLALEDADGGELLGAALKNRYLEWRERERLTASLAADTADFLEGLAASSRQTEINRCAYIESRVAEELTAVRGENAQRRGFYETVYTLAGAAVAIALM